ncbi:MAG TPA: hypothetical protein VKQ71_05510, partial [Acidimicrobiales bacterium]|nr:hypothetical protein [Acidimicrobiales bacterium]
MSCSRGLLAGGRRIAAGAAGVVVVLLALVAFAGPASAHPLGNFTVNRFARVEISTDVIRLYYVLDEAEIPTFQERGSINADRVAFAGRRAGDIAAHLALTVDGQPVALHPAAVDLSLPPGQGGLPTLRLAIRFEGTPSAAAPGATRRATIGDGNEPDRIGWREIVVVARGDATVTTSTAPGRDVSDELRHYPADLIQAPLNLRTASFEFVPGAVAVPPLPIARAAAAPARYGGTFTSLVQRRLTPFVLLGMLAIAVVFGAGHALAPGHGKTIMAAYLVGTKGRPRDAVLLGGIVSVMHTGSVLILGMVLFQLSRSASPDRVYPWLKLISGLAVALFGCGLVWTRWRRRARRGPPTSTDVVDLRREPSSRVVVAVGEPVLVAAGGMVLDREVDGPSHRRHGGEDLDHLLSDGAPAERELFDDGHDHLRDGVGHDHGLGRGDHDHGFGGHHHGFDGGGHEHGSKRAGHDHALGSGDHDHGFGGHDHGLNGGGHDHADGHHHGPGGHTHDLPEGVAPMSRRGLAVLATTGGLFPSPSALIVLLAAFQLHRIGLGLTLIGAFSVGLAATLTGVGLALVYGRRIVERRG